MITHAVEFKNVVIPKNLKKKCITVKKIPVFFKCIYLSPIQLFFSIIYKNTQLL